MAQATFFLLPAQGAGIHTSAVVVRIKASVLGAKLRIHCKQTEPSASASACTWVRSGVWRQGIHSGEGGGTNHEERFEEPEVG
jgi:hypothetical protein